MIAKLRPKYNPDNPMRSRIIFLEGLDKCGKSTLYQLIRIKGDHEFQMADRGIMTKRVFHVFRKAQDPAYTFPLQDWNSLELKLRKMDAMAYVVLHLSPEMSLQRTVEAGETPEFTVEELRTQEYLFGEEIQRARSLGIPVFEIDTENMTLDEVLEEVLGWLKGGKEWINK